MICNRSVSCLWQRGERLFPGFPKDLESLLSDLSLRVEPAALTPQGLRERQGLFVFPPVESRGEENIGDSPGQAQEGYLKSQQRFTYNWVQDTVLDSPMSKTDKDFCPFGAYDTPVGVTEGQEKSLSSSLSAVLRALEVC